MARLIRTEKEVEGRYEEVWLVVEEDSLDQWPAGPREVVGRDAVRVDGRERATGQAVYTADLKLPGMLHTAVLRSPHPRARVSWSRSSGPIAACTPGSASAGARSMRFTRACACGDRSTAVCSIPFSRRSAV